MIENLKDEKILITGGTGFIGRYLVEQLTAKNLTPTILTRHFETTLAGKNGRRADFAEVDLNDGSSLKLFLESFRPSIIIHLAGQTGTPNGPADALNKLNFEATARLLELAETIKIKKFIMTGTADEYGFQTAPQSETMPTMPVSDYAVSKNKAVEYALSLYQKSNLPIVVLRPFTIYGPGQPKKMFVSQAVEAAIKAVPFEMSEGMQKRDLLFVTDFVNAIIKTLTVERIEGEVFNVGSGTSIRLRDLAERIWEIVGADQKLLNIGARQTKNNELHDTEADNSKIRKRLGWEPKISLESGLRLIVNQAKKELQ